MMNFNELNLMTLRGEGSAPKDELQERPSLKIREKLEEKQTIFERMINFIYCVIVLFIN